MPHLGLSGPMADSLQYIQETELPSDSIQGTANTLGGFLYYSISFSHHDL